MGFFLLIGSSFIGVNNRPLEFVGHFIINPFCPETLKPFLHTWIQWYVFSPLWFPLYSAAFSLNFTSLAFNPSITSFPFQQMPPSCPPRLCLISTLLVDSYLSFLCLVVLPFLQISTSPRLGWDTGHRWWTTSQIQSHRTYRHVWFEHHVAYPHTSLQIFT